MNRGLRYLIAKTLLEDNRKGVGTLSLIFTCHSSLL